ncbi:MAG: hypothetical protein ABR915_14760, partial [Thermoguttaceae bacterium]
FTIEMVTLQMRYMTSVDESGFERELVAAAQAACRGDADSARSKLQAAFDLLHSAREYFYPADAYLLDLTLVAPTTLGASFREAIGAISPLPTNLRSVPGEAPTTTMLRTVPDPGVRAISIPINLLISGQVLDEMARRETASLELLREALEAGRAAVVGGEFQEFELPLLPPEAIRYQLEKGLAIYQRRLGRRPEVFGRRRFGMTPALPQILDRLGFTGVVHATLDDGRFPAEGPGRIRWQGIDGTALETLALVPADLSRSDAFLRLSQNLSGTMEGGRMAAAIFAHWPGRSSPWYRDLQRIVRYTSVLGTFVTTAKYFEQTGYPGQQVEHKADEYRSPYLRQEVDLGRADPISRWVRYFSRRAAAEAIQTLATLARLTATSPLPPGERPASGCPGVRGAGPTGDVLAGTLDRVDDSLAAEPSDDPALDDRLRQDLHRAMEAFSRSVGRPAETGSAGVLVANPSSSPQRLCLELPELAAEAEAVGPVVWAGDSAMRRAVVVDVPPLGFAWVGPASGEVVKPEPARRGWGPFRRRPAGPPPLAELVAPPRARGRVGGPSAGKPGALLRNEFFEVRIDPYTGAIRGIYDYQSRGPRLSQQIALRLPAGDAEDAYSIMAADEIAVTSPGPVLGETMVRGRLMDRRGRRVAGFRQTTRIWRGSRTVELEIDLDAEESPGPDPWSSYYAARFAWADDSASLYRSVNQALLPTDAAHMESPHLIDIRGEKLRTSLLCGGLPYHRRFGTRKLDTLLVVRGESARRFRLGVGIDLPQAMAAAMAFLGPRCVQPGWARPPHDAGWLFHLDARGVLATHWEPLVEGGRGESPPPRLRAVPASGGSSELAESRIAGFRVRLLETDGRRVSLGLRSFRAVASARKLGRPDDLPTELSIEGDRIAVELGPYEWAEVEARF